MNDLVEENRLLKLHLLVTEDTTNANNQQPPYQYGRHQHLPHPPGTHYQGIYPPPPPPAPHHHNMPPTHDTHQTQWKPPTYMANYAHHQCNMDNTREILQSTVSILALQTSAMMTSMFHPRFRWTPRSRPYYRRRYNHHYGGQSFQRYQRPRDSWQCDERLSNTTTGSQILPLTI